MKASPAVRAALLEFYDRLSAADLDSFDLLVSPSPATLVIGTAPGEWVTERAHLRHGFETEGFAIEGDDPVAFEQDTVAWAADNPTFRFPDGNAMKARLTTVFHRDDAAWKLVHMHASVGVPDDEVVELQRRWETAP